MFEEYTQYAKANKVVQKFEDSYNLVGVEKLEKFIQNDLTSLEYYILNEYYFNDVSLKKIAKDKNFSYSHVQGTHMRLKSKLNLAIKAFDLDHK